MPWKLISRLLGNGFHWGKSQEELQDAIREAERLNDQRAADHIRIILARRNEVMMEKETPPKRG